MQGLEPSTFTLQVVWFTTDPQKLITSTSRSLVFFSESVKTLIQEHFLTPRLKAKWLVWFSNENINRYAKEPMPRQLTQ